MMIKDLAALPQDNGRPGAAEYGATISQPIIYFDNNGFRWAVCQVDLDPSIYKTSELSYLAKIKMGLANA